MDVDAWLDEIDPHDLAEQIAYDVAVAELEQEALRYDYPR